MTTSFAVSRTVRFTAITLQSNTPYSSGLPSFRGCSTSAFTRSQWTFPPGCAKRSGVRSSTGRKKSSICTSVAPIDCASCAPSVDFPLALPPSSATRTGVFSAFRALIRSINREILSCMFSRLSKLILYHVLPRGATVTMPLAAFPAWQPTRLLSSPAGLACRRTPSPSS